MSRRIFLIRHGLTAWNNEKRYQGHTDIKLSPEGINQAMALQKRLAGENFEAVFSSDLNRAYETARIIAEPHGLEVQVTPGLKEMNFGVWEGLTFPDLEIKYPELIKIWMERPQDLLIPEGESFKMVRDRALSTIIKICGDYPLGNLMFVSHGGTIAAVLTGLLGLPVERMWTFRQKNSALNILVQRGDRFVLDAYNDTCHLSG